MKKLFWIFLLANAVLYAMMQSGGLGWGEPEVHAQPPLHAELMSLIPAPQSASAKISPVLGSASGAVISAPDPVAAAPAPESYPPSLQLSMDMATPTSSICLEWGDFSGADLTRATAALSALKLGKKLSQRQIERDIGYWVYIPPLKNKAEVHRKITQLKARGIKEYFVVQTSGPWRNAISLGVFKTHDAAQNFLREVQAKGVHSAQAGERASKLASTLFVLNRVDAAIKGKLTAIQKDFAGSELNNVPCALTR